DWQVSRNTAGHWHVAHQTVPWPARSRVSLPDRRILAPRNTACSRRDSPPSTCWRREYSTPEEPPPRHSSPRGSDGSAQPASLIHGPPTRRWQGPSSGSPQTWWSFSFFWISLLRYYGVSSAGRRCTRQRWYAG